MAGGGALGAWQAGCLETLTKYGHKFDKVLGFSAGALTGAGYFMGRIPELITRWMNIDAQRILRFSPRLNPLSLFSSDGLRDPLESALDDARVRADAVCELTVLSLRIDDGVSEYSRFTPEGGGAWDGPLAERLVASCSIPTIFPPVRINGKTYIDGGIPGREWFRCDAVADCRDVIVVEMVRPEEMGQEYWNPVSIYEQKGRDLVRKQIDSGVASLENAPNPPRIYRLYPSRVLDFSMLSFQARYCVPALEQGRKDAAAFLKGGVPA